MPHFNGNTSFTCQICGAQSEMYELYEEQGACSACVCRLANLYARAHFGEPMPEFCAEGEWEAYQEEREALAARSGRSRYTKKPIPQGLRTKVFERDGFRCQLCGAQKDLRADHIHPERHGGPTTLENLQTLCQSCNGKKGARRAAVSP